MSEKLRAKKAILISRVSTSEQSTDDRLSPAAQMRALDLYAEKLGLQVLARHEIAESASKVNRPKFEAAIKKISAYRECIAIVTERIDRFSRGQSRVTLELDELRKQGRVELHFVTSGPLVIHRFSSAGEIAMWKVQIDFAEYEAGTKHDNVMRSIREALSRGEYRKKAPLGYLNVEKSAGVKPRLEPDPKRAELVKQAFELYGSGEYTFELLAEELARKGLTIPARRKDGVRQPETPVDACDIRLVLKCRTFTGTFTQVNPDDPEGPLLEIKGTNYEPLISQELFDKVQRLIADTAQRPIGGPKRHYKFSKMIRCGFCGLHLSSENLAHTFPNPDSPGAREVYYRCSCGKLTEDRNWYLKKFGKNHTGFHVADRGKRKGQEVINCPQQGWKERELEAEIVAALESIDYDEDKGKEFKEIQLKDYAERAGVSDMELRRLRSEDSKQKTLERHLIDSYALESDEDIRKVFKSRLQEVRKRRADIETEIKGLEEVEKVDVEEVMETLELCRNFAAYYRRMGPDDQVRFLRSCFSGIVAYRGEYRQPKPEKEKQVLVVDSRGQEYFEDENDLNDKADSEDFRDHLVKAGAGKKVKVNRLGLLWSEPFRKLYEQQIIKKSDRIMNDNRYALPTVKGSSITKKRKTRAFLFA